MKIVTCDICGNTIKAGEIRVEVRDGEHPHSGSTMTKIIDVCHECITKFPQLNSTVEFSELRNK